MQFLARLDRCSTGSTFGAAIAGGGLLVTWPGWSSLSIVTPAVRHLRAGRHRVFRLRHGGGQLLRPGLYLPRARPHPRRHPVECPHGRARWLIEIWCLLVAAAVFSCYLAFYLVKMTYCLLAVRRPQRRRRRHPAVDPADGHGGFGAVGAGNYLRLLHPADPPVAWCRPSRRKIDEGRRSMGRVSHERSSPDPDLSSRSCSSSWAPASGSRSAWSASPPSAWCSSPAGRSAMPWRRRSGPPAPPGP